MLCRLLHLAVLGIVVIGFTQTGSAGEAQPAPAPMGETPSLPVPVPPPARNAVLYEEPDDATGDASNSVRAIDATVTWRYVENGANGPAVEANLQVPERGMKVRVTLHKSADTSLPASHLIEIQIEVPPDLPGKGIKEVPRIIFKPTEEARGQPLVGAAAKITDGFFWIALSDADADVSANLALMRKCDWIALPFVYETGRHATLTFEKGGPGDQAFQQAIGAWTTEAGAMAASNPERPAEPSSDAVPTASSANEAAAAAGSSPDVNGVAETAGKAAAGALPVDNTASCPEIYSIPRPVPRVNVEGFSVVPPKSNIWCGALGLFHSTLSLWRASELAIMLASPGEEPAHGLEVSARRVAVPGGTLDDAGALLELTNRWLASGAASKDLTASESLIEIGAPLDPAPSMTAATDRSIGLDCVRYHFASDTEEKDGLLCLDPGSTRDLIQLGSIEKNASGLKTEPLLTDALKPDIDSFVESIWLAPPGDDDSVERYRQAAERNLWQAQFSLGMSLDANKYYVEAAKWYRLAADQGHPGARNNLGVLYEYGRGVQQDYAEAVKWYRLVAEQGDTLGQYNLGVRYENGRGVPQDYLEAAKWYRLAADQGSARSQYQLALLYAEGKGVREDLSEAVKWFRRSADQGFSLAQSSLGVSYERGNAVSLDLVRAYMWFTLAAARANGDFERAYAADGLKRLTKTMTADQIATGKRLAAKWKPGFE